MKGILERTAVEDLWKHTLSRIPTAYGRLTYLASLRDANSGIYRHHGLNAIFGREETENALRQSHERAFQEWLKLSLAEKNDDLMEYLGGLEDSREVVIRHWFASGVYRSLIPHTARKMQRELFCRDLDALVETISNGLDAGAPAPTS